MLQIRMHDNEAVRHRNGFGLMGLCPKGRNGSDGKDEGFSGINIKS